MDRHRVLRGIWPAAFTAAFLALAVLAQPSGAPPEEAPPAAAAPVSETAESAPPVPSSEFGTSYHPPAGALIAPGRAPDLLILNTGDIVGFVDVCGCPRNPAGGLARRGWVIDQLKKNYPSSPQVLLDSGNFYDNPTPAGDVKTEALIDGMGRLGYSAVNVGERELMLGYDDFVRRTAEAKFPFVSTNIVRQDSKDPVFRPFVILEVPRREGKAPLRVGVLGIVRFNPLFLKAGPQKSNLVIAQPREALKRHLPEVRRRADVVVLLAGLHHDDARLLAKDIGGIDFVLGAYNGHASSQEEIENGARLVYVGNQGKYLGENRLFFDAATGQRTATVTYVHFLTSRYPDDAKMQQFVGEVMAKLNEGTSAERQKKAAAKAAAEERPYAGPSTCSGCHAVEHAQWMGTRHARALETLVEKGREADPACVPCHVTGGAESGGYEDRETTPDLAGVTCESCHGPGTEHAGRPKRGYGKIELASCIGCHNHANSPRFDYYTYLPKVVHAAERTAR